jgi:indole-3-glycerol phosphate synthase/phosphoribosylanthranilate isomerase
MQHDILAEITEKRRADIEKLGVTFGCRIPEKRLRPVVPFMQVPGTILEIKRASPSRGMIAPELDAAETAAAYVRAGTAAVSVLTEQSYFHGSLDDLIAVAAAVGTRAAVLRKDFLLTAEEVNVAYTCGADAVLLIARILEPSVLQSMADRAFTLGLSVLLEIREEDDCEKAYGVMRLAHDMGCDAQLVLGINARDLATFRVDLLAPIRIRCRMAAYCSARKEHLRLPPVIAESGITTETAARFAGTMNFRGILIGEAAARSPLHADTFVHAFVHAAGGQAFGMKDTLLWEKIASHLDCASGKRPLVKICGITNEDDAHAAATAGADFLGFVFCAESRRSVNTEIVRNIRASFQKDAMPVFIGVITDSESDESRKASLLVQEGILDGIQYHSCSPDGRTPGYPAVRVRSAEELVQMKALLKAGHHRVLIDAFDPGSPGGTGKRIDEAIVMKAAELSQLWLAGGITGENVRGIVQNYHPELIDVSSGVEKEPGIKDHAKISRLFSEITY